jgi:hypothetical protein
MHFALIDGQLTEAMPGLKGHCPGCAAPMVAKCGELRMHHWAHQNRPVCDDWWEPETVWHRQWKNQFPESWQENFLTDELTGEKHIADVLTDYGFVLEFQHSHITPEERRSRENFYKNMVWVIDGTRLKRDHSRFLRKQKKFSWTDNDHIFHVQDPEDCFPISWVGSSVPVIFDYKGATEGVDENKLYCIFPQRIASRVTMAVIPRNAFIRTVNNGDWLTRLSGLMEILDKEKAEWDQVIALAREQDRINELNRQARNREMFYRKVIVGRRRRW